MGEVHSDVSKIFSLRNARHQNEESPEDRPSQTISPESNHEKNQSIEEQNAKANNHKHGNCSHENPHPHHNHGSNNAEKEALVSFFSKQLN